MHTTNKLDEGLEMRALKLPTLQAMKLLESRLDEIAGELDDLTEAAEDISALTHDQIQGMVSCLQRLESETAEVAAALEWLSDCDSTPAETRQLNGVVDRFRAIERKFVDLRESGFPPGRPQLPVPAAHMAAHLDRLATDLGRLESTAPGPRRHALTRKVAAGLASAERSMTPIPLMGAGARYLDTTARDQLEALHTRALTAGL